MVVDDDIDGCDSLAYVPSTSRDTVVLGVEAGNDIDGCESLTQVASTSRGTSGDSLLVTPFH